MFRFRFHFIITLLYSLLLLLEHLQQRKLFGTPRMNKHKYTTVFLMILQQQQHQKDTKRHKKTPSAEKYL